MYVCCLWIRLKITTTIEACMHFSVVVVAVVTAAAVVIDAAAVVALDFVAFKFCCYHCTRTHTYVYIYLYMNL